MTRLDKRMVEEGLAESRTKALRLIARGMVRVNGVVCLKPAHSVMRDDVVSMVEDARALRFIGQGGEKLHKALEIFNIDLTGQTVLDIGSSTGGFTDCALQHGAKKLYSVDVGRGQLHPSLLENNCVCSIEQQDIRTLGLEQVGGVPFEVIVCDVSFISLSHVIPHMARLIAPHGSVICLVKPQFEVGPRLVNQRGIVTSLRAQRDAIEHVCNCAMRYALAPIALTYSPIGGQGRNTEYLLYLESGGKSPRINVENVVLAAHKAFRRSGKHEPDKG